MNKKRLEERQAHYIDALVNKTWNGKRVPPNLHHGILNHIMRGEGTGSFLQAVLENDLLRAVQKADMNSMRNMEAIVGFLYSYAPRVCWGSPDKVSEWRVNGGFEGMD